MQLATLDFFFIFSGFFRGFEIVKSSQNYFTFFSKSRISIFWFFLSLQSAYFRAVETLVKLKVRNSLHDMLEKPQFTNFFEPISKVKP